MYLYSATASQARRKSIPQLLKALTVSGNSMNNTLIIKKAVEEIETKNFGVTEQFLEVHKIVYQDNAPIISRIDTEKNNGMAIVYFPVVDEKFHLAVGVETKPEVAVSYVQTESYNSVCFRASSDNLSLEELAKKTKLEFSKGRSKGEPKNPKDGTGVLWPNSTIIFEPNPEPDEFEDKLTKLLDYLDHDKKGIKELINNANGYIQIAIEFHNGNTMLGGPHISKKLLKRMATFNLEIDFDLYVSGNFFRS